MPTEKPLPCPFCGGRGVVHGFANFDGVRCDRCGAVGPLCITEEAAIRRWNTRRGETK